MKKLSIITFALFLLKTVLAQQISNGGMEDWTNNRPIGWGTEDFLATQLGKPLRFTAVRDTLIKHSGKSSIRLRSDTAKRPDNLANYSGFLCYCDIFIDPIGQNKNFVYKSFNSRPDSLVFWYKYSQGMKNNAAVVVFESYKKDMTKVGDIQGEFKEAKTWKRASFPVEYLSNALPDSLFLSFTSSFEDPAMVKDTLWLDDIGLVYKTVGIHKLDADEVFQIFPNPAINFIIIETPQATEITITVFDVLGKEIIRQNSTSKQTHLSLESLSTGNYLVRVLDVKTKEFAERKIVKQ